MLGRCHRPPGYLRRLNYWCLHSFLALLCRGLMGTCPGAQSAPIFRNDAYLVVPFCGNDACLIARRVKVMRSRAVPQEVRVTRVQADRQAIVDYFHRFVANTVTNSGERSFPPVWFLGCGPMVLGVWS